MANGDNTGQPGGSNRREFLKTIRDAAIVVTGGGAIYAGAREIGKHSEKQRIASEEKATKLLNSREMVSVKCTTSDLDGAALITLGPAFSLQDVDHTFRVPTALRKLNFEEAKDPGKVAAAFGIGPGQGYDVIGGFEDNDQVIPITANNVTNGGVFNLLKALEKGKEQEIIPAQGRGRNAE